jgi:hypothetical protein
MTTRSIAKSASRSAGYAGEPVTCCRPP